MERDGLFERLGVLSHWSGSGELLHFRLTPLARQLLGLDPRPDDDTIEDGTDHE